MFVLNLSVIQILLTPSKLLRYQPKNILGLNYKRLLQKSNEKERDNSDILDLIQTVNNIILKLTF